MALWGKDNVKGISANEAAYMLTWLAGGAGEQVGAVALMRGCGCRSGCAEVETSSAGKAKIQSSTKDSWCEPSLN